MSRNDTHQTFIAVRFFPSRIRFPQILGLSVIIMTQKMTDSNKIPHAHRRRRAAGVTNFLISVLTPPAGRDFFYSEKKLSVRFFPRLLLIFLTTLRKNSQ